MTHFCAKSSKASSLFADRVSKWAGRSTSEGLKLNWGGSSMIMWAFVPLNPNALIPALLGSSVRCQGREDVGILREVAASAKSGLRISHSKVFSSGQIYWSWFKFFLKFYKMLEIDQWIQENPLIIVLGLF